MKVRVNGENVAGRRPKASDVLTKKKKHGFCPSGVQVFGV